MKKILFSALVSTAVITNTFAEAPSPVFDGVYIGGGLNITSEKIKSNGLGSSSFNGGGVKGFLGYGLIFAEGPYLGVELSLGYDQIIRHKKSAGLKNKKTNYGIAARLGYAVHTLLPFVKFGYEGRSSTGSIRRNAAILGGGMDIALSKAVFVRAEYVHNFGVKSTITINNQSFTFKNHADTFLLGAGYRY